MDLYTGFLYKRENMKGYTWYYNGSKQGYAI